MMSEEAMNVLHKLLISRAEAAGVHCKKEKEEEERREKGDREG
jgi:hypothetical protein